MCDERTPPSMKRITLAFVLLVNGRPISLRTPMKACGYQVQSLTFKVLPVDPVGTLFVVTCDQLACEGKSDCVIVSDPVQPLREVYRNALLMIPQDQLSEHQDYEPVWFDRIHDIHYLRFIIGSEEEEYDATQINPITRCTLVIDFFEPR